MSLPAYQKACGGVDIMAQVIERYMTQVRDAWAEIMWAGSVAHNSLPDTGRVGDWASHMIEHELHAFKDIPHGAGLTIILSEKTALEGIEKYIAFNKSLGLPSSLSEIGIGETDFRRIAERTAIS
jgi:alcohol dehydrogenase YqhD (iron-dependent ADH family)